MDHLARGLGHAHLLAALDPEPDAGRLAVGVDDGDVGDVHRGFLVLDPTLRVALAGRRVALNHVQARHHHSPVLRRHPRHGAGAALVLAGEHDHPVALLDLGGHGQSTSGASEMIFMWFLARSSRGTGPKMRVPIGSICLLTITAAFLSKRITDPSLRLMAWLVRTTIACSTSPFFTRPRGMGSLTDTTMRSPTEAYRRPAPPSTLM